MKKIFLVLLSLVIPFSVSAKEFRYNAENIKVQHVNSEKADAVVTFTELIGHLENTDVSNEKLSDCYFRRGYYYEKNYKDLNNALADYNTAIKYNPNNKLALFYASALKNKFHDIEGALQDIKKYIVLEPNDEVAHLIAAFLYSDLKQYNNAINECTQSIKIKNKNPNAFYRRGLNEVMIGKIDKGLQDLGYAKRQYYELNDIDNYRNVSNVINDLNKVQNNNYKSPLEYKTNTNYSSNYETTNELKKINNNLEKINRNMYMLPQNNDSDIKLLEFMFNNHPAPHSHSQDIIDMYMLFGN